MLPANSTVLDVVMGGGKAAKGGERGEKGKKKKEKRKKEKGEIPCSLVVPLKVA